MASFNEPSLKSSDINVETFKGIVQLSGFVDDKADIAKAEEIARQVKGVGSFKNAILPSNRSPCPASGRSGHYDK